MLCRPCLAHWLADALLQGDAAVTTRPTEAALVVTVTLAIDAPASPTDGRCDGCRELI